MTDYDRWLIGNVGINEESQTIKTIMENNECSEEEAYEIYEEYKLEKAAERLQERLDHE